MGENPNQGAGDGEKARSDAIKAAASESAGSDGNKPEAHDSAGNLPVVWSPKLDAADAADEMPALDAEEAPPTDDETANDAPGETAAQPRSSRFALLATTIAIAAASGAFIGALTAYGIVRLSTGASITVADANTVPQAIKLQLAELSAIKTNLDNASRNANSQLAKIADRLDRVERAEADPATKLAHIADAVDRLDKRNAAAADITGSIATATPSSAEPKLPVLDGWIVQDVQAGRALVASRNGGEFDVGAGSFLPSIGRVEAIKRQDGQWVVVTARGLITSGR